MSYIELINAFERWLENNYLPAQSQLLFYKFLVIFNRSAWAEWVSVDNLRLMYLARIQNESTLLRHRDNLVRSGLIEYQKGKKGFPNRYKINTSILQVFPQVETQVKAQVFPQVEVQAETQDINRLRQRQTKKDISNEISKKSAARCSRPKNEGKPSYEELEAYCKEQGVNTEEVWDYYESNGWRVGKNPMKDWKAVVRNWKRRQFSGASAKKQQEPQKDYSFDLEAFEREHKWRVPDLPEGEG